MAYIGQMPKLLNVYQWEMYANRYPVYELTNINHVPGLLYTDDNVADDADTSNNDECTSVTLSELAIGHISSNMHMDYTFGNHIYIFSSVLLMYS